jgi:hypothetical protein
MNSANQTTPDADLSKCTVAFGFSLAVTSVVSALLVVAKELSPNLVMAWMKRLTGQHWVTHSLIAVVLFGIFGAVFSRANSGAGLKMSASRLIFALAGGVILGGLIIAGFYLFVG